MPALAMKSGATKAERVTGTRMDTIQVTPEIVSSWPLAPSQRPLKINLKVKELSETIKRDGGVIPGIVTLAHLGRHTGIPFLLDGQHRREAFLLSGCPMGYVDIREAWFDTLAEMGQEFVNLNSALVKITPDDVLRGLEQSSLPLTKIKQACPYVGYEFIRRGPNNALVSMSAALRCWEAGRRDVPSGGQSATVLAATMTLESAEQLVGFLGSCFKAWGRDPEYWRLWGNLNLTLCSWLYQRTVTGTYSAKTPKLSKENWTKGLMSLSADAHYIDWLLGRHVGDRDRSPAYNLMKTTIAKRLSLETGRNIMLPKPPWAGGRG